MAADDRSGESLDARLAALEGGHLAPFARKLAEMLAGIRADFQGETRRRLEAEVEAALDRQLAVDAGRERATQALAELARRQSEMIDALYGLYLATVPDEGATRH